MNKLILFLVIFVTGCGSYNYSRYREPLLHKQPTISAIKAPRPSNKSLRNLEMIPVVCLEGREYSRGFQYGSLYAYEWKYAVLELEKSAIRAISRYLFFYGFSKMAYQRYVDYVYAQAEDYIPGKYKAYIQGIADGSGLKVYEVARLVSTVMVSDSSCSGFIAFGNATEDGRLIQTRNLDWGDSIMKPQTASVLLVHRPTNGYQYLSIGFIGLVGSVSGINEHGISLTEIGANSKDKTRAGFPMPLMLEEVLSQAKTLDEAILIIKNSPGTGGYNFLVGSAKERRGCVIEKTATLFAAYNIGKANYQSFTNFFYDFEGFDCRADLSANQEIRKNHDFDLTPKSYGRRYLPQVELFRKFKQINIEKASRIMRKVAPRSNLHSIIYDFERGRVYFRNKAWMNKDALNKQEERDIIAAFQEPAVIELGKLWKR